MSRTDQCVLSVIAPCYNEAVNIDLLVRRTLAAFDAMTIDGQLILVDDGSVDETWAAISAAADEDRRVWGVRHERNRGIVPAWQSGLDAARGRLVCLIDSDLQNRPEDIARLHRVYELGGADVVQGARRPVCTVHRHRVFTRGLNALLNLAFRTRLRDNKSGFLLCRRDTLSAILRHRLAYRYFQAFVGVAATARGFVIKEVDTVFEPRRAGQSFLSRFPIRTSLRIVWELIKFRAETWLDARGRVGRRSVLLSSPASLADAL